MLRDWKFMTFTVLVLTLGISANTIVFTLVDAVLLRDYGFGDSQSLVWIWGTRTDRDKAFFSIPNFIDMRDAAHTLSDIAAFANWSASLTGSGEAERLSGIRISPNAFEMLGVRAGAGRLISRSDGEAAAGHVVVLSYELWMRRFGAERGVLGSKILLSGD